MATKTTKLEEIQSQIQEVIFSLEELESISDLDISVARELVDELKEEIEQLAEEE